jgi:hypothetical protein
MPEIKRRNIPDTGYDIQVKINNLDYSNDLISLRIISSLVSSYQIVILEMILDQTDIIFERIYGKDPINLIIRYLGRGTENQFTEEIRMELIHLSSDSKMTIRNTQSKEDNKFLERVTFVTVPRNAFKTTSTLINEIYINKTCKEIISDFVSKNTKAKLNIDNDNINNEKIEQIVIPPMPLNKVIRYLDNNFGIYNGASNSGFCQYDNVFNVFNLSKRITKSQIFNIYQLSTDGEDNKKIINKCIDGENFYSYDSLVNTYSGNTKLASLSKKINHIVKPSDRLYHIISQDLEKICSDFGANVKNKELFIDPILNERETYKTTQTGNELSDVFANSRIARSIIGLSNVIVNLEKNLPILNLMKIGEPVMLKTGTLEYIDLSGKYILKSSDLSFSRESVRNWMSFAKLILIRTNKTL